MSRNRLFDKIVVLDLEATCDEPRPRWHGEIIEVGVCLLDIRNLEISNQRGILVRPVNTPVTPFCTSLTTLTPELVQKEGVTLLEAMRILKDDYKIDQRCWASWGDYDRKQLVGECSSKGLVFWGENSTHFNIKQILALEYGWRSGEGLDRALERFGMTLDGTHHRGVDDANNIARIYANHLKRVRRS